MQDTQVNTFNGGLDFDSDLRSIKTDRYVDALNVETMSIEKNGINAITPMKSSSLAFSVPDIFDEVQFTKLKYEEDVNINFYFYGADGALLGQGFIPAAINTDFAAFEVAFTTAMFNYGYDVADFDLSANGEYFLSSIEFGSQPVRVSFLWQVDGEYYDEIVVQEAYVSSKLRPIATSNVENRLFVFSSTGNSNAIEIGIATKNVTWSYTRIFRTWRFLLPTTEAIDIRVEKVSNQSWAVYWTDNTNKPKVLYIPEVYTQDCVAKYNVINWEIPTSGYIIYNEANEQTNLQLINNAGLVTYSDQLQAGGNLRSGGYRYSVRFGVNGTENTTEWSVLTPNVIPVFEASINSASAYIKVQGEKGGVATSKANVLLIQNALPNIYNFVELACVYNSGGANSASIVGRFDVTSSEFTVTHTGFEQGVIEFSTDLLPQTEPVILKAKSLEIKKNRLNLANLEIGADDPVLAAIASAATISQVKEELTQVGKIGSGGLLDVSASFLAPVEYTFAMYSPVTTAPDLIFNVENKDVNGEYNPTTGVFTKLGSPAQIKISMGISYTIGVSGRIGFIIMKNGVFYAYAQTGRIAAGSSTLPFDVMSYFSNNVINFNGTPLNVNDTISFKIWWQPDSVDPADKIIIIPTGSFLNIGTTNVQGDFSLSKVGEYQLPENCATKVGYMLNETYPFFMRFHYKNGYISSPYYIDSYTFNDDNSGQLYNDALEDYTYSYGAVVSNINISSVKDRINGVSIWRGECNPTVLGSGVYFNSDDFTSDYYIVGEYAGIPQGNNRYALLYNSTNDRRKFGLFFSHDTRIEKTGYIDGAYLKLYGAPKPFNSLSGITNGSNIASYAEYLGVQTTSYESSNNTIIDAYYNDFSTLGATKLENTAILGYKPNTDHTKGSTGNLEGIAMTVSNFVNSNHGSDNGVYMAQYIRPIAGSQYDLNSINIVPTGTYLNTNKIPSGIAPNLRVFGGDTYTQKNILKVRYWSTFDNVTIRSSFITYYAQQKINTQMFFCDENETVKFTRNLQGWKSINDYLFPFKESEDVAEEQFNYDRGFSAQYPLRLTAYNPNLPAESKFISRIHYSQQKPINSLQDFYRKIGAFDFRDLDTKNGNIAAIRDVNNYMVAIQPRAISVLPYLSDVALTSQGGGQVLVGTGGVYNQRENIISTYGTSLQTCTLVGNNNNGNSTLYWFSPEFKKYCRYGGDGIKVLSDDNSMRSFFLTMDAQAEYDMVQVFDIEHASVIMTWGGAQSKTLFFNEKSNNFSSFASFIPLRYFPYQNITLAPRISATDYNQIYELSGGTNYLSYLGAAPSVFRIEYVANKGGMSSKRFLSAALSVGEGYTFTNPAVSMSVNGDVVFPHTITTFQKRHDNWFGAFNKAAGKQPIGQYGVVKVESSAYIVILGAVTKFRNIFRSLFK